MAITFVGVTSGSGSNPQLALPLGTGQGDLMIMVTTGANTPTVPLPDVIC
jgi:hypothetical protein